MALLYLVEICLPTNDGSLNPTSCRLDQITLCFIVKATLFQKKG